MNHFSKRFAKWFDTGASFADISFFVSEMKPRFEASKQLGEGSLLEGSYESLCENKRVVCFEIGR